MLMLMLAVILYKSFRKKKRRRDIICSEGEGQQMISIKSKTRWEITKEFQNYLEKEIHGMFPNILNTFYFVPPVYFNRTQYKTQLAADEVIYVLDSHDPPDFRQDQALQHVFHCLRHMAEQRQEQMFVLTQFRYEDYLNSPDSKYNKHKLPVPADLKEADKRTKCFDLLIFHRSLGVLVVVVKPVSGDGHDDHQKLASLVELELSEAIQQLNMANSILKHLMSDQDVHPIIRHAVIMPNLESSSLREAINTDSKVVKNLLRCLGATAEEKVEDLCLCAEHLSKPDTPWDVSSEVVSNMQRWFKKIMKIPVLDTSSYEKFYVSMIARFCGPATKSSLKVPNASAPFVLPKTLDEAVFLTGQMFERSVLSSDMAELLNSQRRFLYGPPNTGKTRMLTLIGKKCLSSGNDVLIVKDESSKSDSFLSEHLQALAASNTKLPRSTFGSVYTETCDLKQKTAEIIDRIKSQEEKKVPLVLLDDVHLDEQNLKIVLEALLKEFQGLWVTSISRHTCSEGLPESSLTCCLNCPPATLRVAPLADRVYGKHTGSNEASQHFFPTDGPPVKYFYHRKQSHLGCRLQ
ncbi:uncharacterized protein LOC112576124 [Pomacea canaliculata]|uniref:uncharacterized protein LOC112576124 n=1 Tax=Pomacea canaliculata TaxID=400727 RepID=UPI000D7320DC|nr:uncharacterized protein LOC112576124 [Pomacea canaliculata]